MRFYDSFSTKKPLLRGLPNAPIVYPLKQVSCYQQTFLVGKKWDHWPGMRPPPKKTHFIENLWFSDVFRGIKREHWEVKG